MKAKPYYTWYWLDGMHIGYTPERIRVEKHCGVVEYVPDSGTYRNLTTKPTDIWEQLEKDFDSCIEADSISHSTSLALKGIKRRIRKLRGEGR